MIVIALCVIPLLVLDYYQPEHHPLVHHLHDSVAKLSAAAANSPIPAAADVSAPPATSPVPAALAWCNCRRSGLRRGSAKRGLDGLRSRIRRHDRRRRSQAEILREALDRHAGDRAATACLLAFAAIGPSCAAPSNRQIHAFVSPARLGRAGPAGRRRGVGCRTRALVAIHRGNLPGCRTCWPRKSAISKPCAGRSAISNGKSSDKRRQVAAPPDARREHREGGEVSLKPQSPVRVSRCRRVPLARGRRGAASAGARDQLDKRLHNGIAGGRQARLTRVGV